MVKGEIIITVHLFVCVWSKNLSWWQYSIDDEGYQVLWYPLKTMVVTNILWKARGPLTKFNSNQNYFSHNASACDFLTAINKKETKIKSLHSIRDIVSLRNVHISHYNQQQKIGLKKLKPCIISHSLDTYIKIMVFYDFNHL